ncbi:MAG TPA: hypothetical protein VGY57_05730 [Vicinamibacterales bacterium]|jgi:hypothetical protein|nr:hypothetical protein [Vicinamibacterales bacterium]
MIRRRSDSLVQILAFVMVHLVIFEATSVGKKMVAALQQLVAQLTTLFTTDSSARDTAHDHTVERAKARKALLRSGKAIRRTGLLLALDGAATEERFPQFRSVSDRQLAADARSVLEKALPLKAAFVAHGLPSSVIEDLPAQIEAMDQAIQHQSTGREMHVAAKRAAGVALTSAAPIVKALESILLNAPNVDALTLEAWKSAKRIGPARDKAVAPQAPAPVQEPAKPSSPNTSA